MLVKPAAGRLFLPTAAGFFHPAPFAQMSCGPGRGRIFAGSFSWNREPAGKSLLFVEARIALLGFFLFLFGVDRIDTRLIFDRVSL